MRKTLFCAIMVIVVISLSGCVSKGSYPIPNRKSEIYPTFKNVTPIPYPHYIKYPLYTEKLKTIVILKAVEDNKKTTIKSKTIIENIRINDTRDKIHIISSAEFNFPEDKKDIKRYKMSYNYYTNMDKNLFYDFHHTTNLDESEKEKEMLRVNVKKNEELLHNIVKNGLRTGDVCNIMKVQNPFSNSPIWAKNIIRGYGIYQNKKVLVATNEPLGLDFMTIKGYLLLDPSTLQVIKGKYLGFISMAILGKDIMMKISGETMRISSHSYNGNKNDFKQQSPDNEDKQINKAVTFKKTKKQNTVIGEKLSNLQKLYKDNLITKDEYDNKKKQLLNDY